MDSQEAKTGCPAAHETHSGITFMDLVYVVGF